MHVIAMISAVVGLALAAGAAPSADVPPAVTQAASHIDRPAIEAPVRYLADDLLEGRGPGSRGDALTRLYLATKLQELGLRPMMPGGGWEQPFDIIGIDTQMPPAWVFRGRRGELRLARRDDFIVASGVQRTRAALTDAELVFVGYGITAPEYQWDDYKGTDLRGKVLVMMNNDPDWDPELFEGRRRLYYGRWTYKYEEAARQGAAGAIIIHTTPSAGYPFSVVQTSWTGVQFELPDEGNEPRLQVTGWLTEDATMRLLASAGHDLDALVASARRRDFAPVPLGLRTSLELATEISRSRTANVGGLLPGRDPALRDEVIVYTAHHDHLGIGEPDASGDRIYNGARDNAAGVAQVLAVARAFAALPEPPRRSVLFLLVAAEEQGLLGSAHFARNPTFHPGRIAANINLDGPNIWGRTSDVTIAGAGKNSIEAVATRLAAAQGRQVKPDAFPDRGIYYRSDQFNFAKIGVPALYLKGGTSFVGRPPSWGREQVERHEEHEYHQPSDQLDERWSFDGLIDDARLVFMIGAAVAEADEMPRWNEGDEFEAIRKQALAAAP